MLRFLTYFKVNFIATWGTTTLWICHYKRGFILNMFFINMFYFTMFWFSVLEQPDRLKFFQETIPHLGRVCQAFPPLCEDVTSLLHQVGRVCMSHIASTTNILEYTTSDGDTNVLVSPYEPPKKRLRVSVNSSESSKYRMLYRLVQHTFSELVQKSLVTKNIYIWMIYATY